MQIALTAEQVEARKGQSFRIGYFIDNGYIRTCPAIRRAILQTKSLLQRNGHSLIQFKLPDLQHYRQALDRDILKDQLKGFFAGIKTYEPMVKTGEMLGQFTKMSKPMIRLLQFMMRNERESICHLLTGKEIVQNRVALHESKHKMQKQLQSLGVDAFLWPVLECVAPESKTFDLGPPSVLPGVVNFLGLTGSSVPVGRVTEDDVKQEYEDYKNDKVGKGMKETRQESIGLPIGVQISSFPGREDIVLALMKEIEEATQELNNYYPTYE